jgi:RNA polymerase sigma-70 factor, ECF subfamily
MKRGAGRSTDVSQTLVAPAKDVPRDVDLAFEELYRSSRDDLYAYVAGMLRDKSAAEDVTAAAFERAYRKRARFDPRRGSRRAWLFGIARNAALDELRRRGRHAELTAEPADASSSVVESAEASARRATVRAALARLGGREREVVSLKFFAGLSILEIATVLGISETNAATRLHRAMTKLREGCDETA